MEIRTKLKLLYLKQIFIQLFKEPGSFNLGELRHSYPEWVNSVLEPNRSPLADELPWINFRAQKFITSILRPEMIGFEYGCGGSSVFFAKRIKHLVSVDHNEAWFDLTKKKMGTMPNLSWQGFLAKSTPVDDYDMDLVKDPEKYFSSAETEIGKSFKDYVSTIDNFPDNYFDFVMIDGRARPACIRHSLKKVKPMGFLILDNSDREFYLSGFNKENLDGNYKLVSHSYGPGPYSFIFSATSFWQKNKG
jgi:hypothetical protein